jgi:hypothetical protein
VEVLELVILVVMMLLIEIHLMIVDVKILFMNTFHIMNADHAFYHAQLIAIQKPNVTHINLTVKTI